MQPLHLIVVSYFTEPIERSGGVSVLVKDVYDKMPNVELLSIHESPVLDVTSLQSRFQHVPSAKILKKIFFWLYISIRYFRYLHKHRWRYETITSCNVVISILTSLCTPKKLVIWENVDYLKARRKFNLIRMSFALRLGATLILTSHFEYNFFKKKFKKYNENIIYKANWTPNLAKPKQIRRLVCVGFLETRKGFDLLIDCYPKNTDIPLLIYGTGPEHGRLQKMIEQKNKNIKLMGFAPNGYLEIERSLGFLLPSRFEGVPLVLIHALKAGVPVAVSSAVSDIEYFKSKVKSDFHVLDVNDPIAMQKQLRDFILYLNEEKNNRKSEWESKDECLREFVKIFR
jgi:glycosyltransferase involved in cell wall biosynthesis